MRVFPITLSPYLAPLTTLHYTTQHNTTERHTHINMSNTYFGTHTQRAKPPFPSFFFSGHPHPKHAFLCALFCIPYSFDFRPECCTLHTCAFGEQSTSARTDPREPPARHPATSSTLLLSRSLRLCLYFHFGQNLIRTKMPYHSQ